MKLYLLKSITALSLLSGLMLTGCLKDKEYDERTIQSNHGDSPKVIEIGLTGTSYRNFVSTSLDASNNDTTLVLFPVQLASNEPAQEDINVTISKSDAAVTAYNATQASVTGFVPYLPALAANTTIVNANGVVTIPKGSYSGLLSIRFKSNSFLGANYAIGFTISSVDKPGYVISGNLQNAVVGVAVKNQYDGVYSVVSGYVQRYTAPGVPENPSALSGNLAGNPDVSLITTGTNSVGIPAPATPNPGALYWSYGNNSAVAGIDNVQIIVDPTTKAVTTSSQGNATLANWETKENKYDPTTKTFTLNFRWNPTANRREYSVILKYKKPR